MASITQAKIQQAPRQQMVDDTVGEKDFLAFEVIHRRTEFATLIQFVKYDQQNISTLVHLLN